VPVRGVRAEEEEEEEEERRFGCRGTIPAGGAARHGPARQSRSSRVSDARDVLPRACFSGWSRPAPPQPTLSLVAAE